MTKKPLVILLVVFGFTSCCVLVGTLCYRIIEHKTWLDSFYGACMVLSTQGPVFKNKTTLGTWFVSLFGLLSSILFLQIISTLLEPWIKRVIAFFSLEEERSLLKKEEYSRYDSYDSLRQPDDYDYLLFV
jgi:hypothetical protein